MKILAAFTLTASFLFACDLGDGGTSQIPSAAITPTQVIARSVMAPFPTPPIGPFACVVGREFSLISVGSELRMKSHQFPLMGCEAVRLPPDFKNYLVQQVTYREGAKTYKGVSQDGAVELIDHRQEVGFEFPWTVTMTEPATDSIGLYKGHLVEDENLKASGNRSYDLLLDLQTAMASEDVKKLVYSLLLDPTWSGPLSDPKTHQVRVISDLALEHVLNQLDVLAPVKNVAVLEVDEDPWPPRR